MGGGQLTSDPEDNEKRSCRGNEATRVDGPALPYSCQSVSMLLLIEHAKRRTGSSQANGC